MNAASVESTRWVLAEIGRLLWVHRLDPALAATALELPPEEAAMLIAGRPGEVQVAPERQDRVSLVLNILVRLEVRCGHDTAAIRAALDRPSDALGGATLAERLLAGPDLSGLRELRVAAGELPVPRIRMWRVADRYS